MAVDTMVMAIVGHDESLRVLEALITAGYTATFGDSRSGVLRQARRTLFIGIEAERLDEVLSIIEENCRSHVALEPTEATANTAPQEMPARAFAEVGSAVVFVWDINRFETY
jgi:uncharacterized protein YaaQ